MASLSPYLSAFPTTADPLSSPKVLFSFPPNPISRRPSPPFNLVLCAAAKSKQSAAAAATGTASGAKPARGITKPRPVSAEMQEFVGVAEIPRTQALKLIWAYIKKHDLQDPEDKRVIVCDQKLKSLFGGRERVGFLEISGLINPHFLK